MFRSEKKCHGEECNSHYIQNKKHHLCSDCVFKKNHNGKSRNEVMNEKMKKRVLSEEEHSFSQNKINQDNIKEIDEKEEKQFFDKERGIKKFITTNSPIKKLTKQTLIDALYKHIIIDMDYVEEKVCRGCLQYQGGNIKLSHSHIISRADCKRIGKPELIYDRRNITYHCMSFAEHVGCHSKWENPTQRSLLEDYQMNIDFITQAAPELLEKYRKQ